MNITKKQNGTTLEVSFEGRLDTISSPGAEKELLPVPADVKEMVLDFRDLEYISSAGLRLLIQLQKELHGKAKLRIINTNEIVDGVFSVTGFDKFLNIE